MRIFVWVCVVARSRAEAPGEHGGAEPGEKTEPGAIK